ncbi:cAMP-dependent protein kinase catalytic subunit [Coemansia sp. RSA 1807]|nr:cAMP-dependent protein kinase catalytic subunit [Coemansia sp. RSA 1824]KAJ1788669.1 cAMP-dependent protein kinase catalytic subunit [Coemansia sp. RSA 2167]KAJ2155613.1 cAMP-dependent protein kinase catalytic subunit [Coemansia sp. RSA 637]KAJ2181995.1 cAMP-dependent protein kinase catalytic subunit [Coemansia sp. RSA 551]KAJ2255323.1 cAMP-dependent protein kinase catalytic subunit [Coemansia sp. RSA 454]KAJ2578383.1 cAMP-dependent protein kinase catalytic subunit [Coemansia sp. RSA 1807]
MAFINKILQKTKHKIGDRDGCNALAEKAHGLDSPTNPPALPNSPADAYTVMPVQKHVVPSNAPTSNAPTSHMSLGARAASFSVGAYGAHQAQYTGQTRGVYPGHTQGSNQNVGQTVPQGRAYDDTHVRLDDFEVFRTVGTGSFGRVRLVRHRATGRYYAMKVLKKSHVVRAKQVEHVNSERAILAECSCPFIVYMLGTCQDRMNLYFFMEYVVGGELFTYLRRYHRFPAPVAKFYAAEVLLALEYMHARNIIWRDTKPENILLDERGHVKLTDMGFAKKVVDRTWTLCGTPDYLAPEVIQAKGYGRSVDWWALGILIFEMIAGYPPFYDEDHYRLYEKILAGRIQWPPQFDPVARDLVSHLLTADLSRRLGNLHRGSADIKEHRWFAEVDWNRLAAREIPAPLIPPQKVAGDTSNFDKYPETAETYGDMVSEDPFADLFVEF